MAAATSKQQNRASMIQGFMQGLDTNFSGLAGVATRASNDGIMLTGADFSGTSFAYITDPAVFDAAIAMTPLILTALATTVTAGGENVLVNGQPITIAQVIAMICNS
jgi:hypothetical protein